MAKAVEPGGVIYLENPLNQSDAVPVSIDWTPFLGSDTIASVAWGADNGITVSGETNTTVATAAILTAGTVTGTRRVEATITTAASTIRSVALEVEIKDLR